MQRKKNESESIISLAIPKQTVKEPSYTIPTTNKKTNPWGTPAKPTTSTLASKFPALPSANPSSTADRFPQLPTKKPSTIRGKPVVIGAAKPSSTPLSTARSAVHSSSQSTSHSTLDFAHVLQQESPQEVLENSPTAAAVAEEEVSPIHPCR